MLGTRQVTFAVIATSVTLIAVFVPISFLEGKVGRLFTEFGFVLAVAVAISTVVALTLCPVLCTKLLRGKPSRARRSAGCSSAASAWLTGLSRALLGARARCAGRRAAARAAGRGASVGLYRSLPRELMPTEDRGVFFIPVTAPQGATLGYTDGQVREVEAILDPLRASGEAARIFAIVGRSGQPHQRASSWSAWLAPGASASAASRTSCAR